jgi:lysophospholipase L1-like esterase
MITMILRICLFLSLASFLPAQPPPAQEAPAAPDITKMKADLERAQKTLQDWPNLKRYAEDNAKIGAPTPGEQRVVFLGDSITDAWGRRGGKFFPGSAFINRGISGQTTPQMLIRFRPDVIELKPKVVVILAGTNDLAGNTGPMTLDMIQQNLTSMAELATANGIRVVFSSVMPVCDYHRPQTARRPPAQILALNTWMQAYAKQHKHLYIDYHSAMQDETGMLKKELTGDGLHPNDAGYAVMEPLAEKAFTQALKQKR